MSRRPTLRELTIPETSLGQSLLPAPAPIETPGEIDMTAAFELNDAWATGDPSALEQLGAAFSRLNSVAMGLRAFNERPSFEPEEGFDPWPHLTGEELDLPASVRGRLLEARSQGELAWLRDQQQRFARLDQIIEAGPMPALLAGAIASIVDPINLLPLGWATVPLRGARIVGYASRGRIIGRGAVAGGVIGMAGGAVIEPLAQFDDPFRTALDATADILISGALGAGIGAGIGAIAAGRVVRARRGEVDAAHAAIRDAAAEAEAARVGVDPATARGAADGLLDAGEQARKLVEGEVPPPGFQPIAKSLSAAVADQDGIAIRALRTEGLKLHGESVLRPIFKALGDKTMGLLEWPGLRLAASRFDTSRRFIASFADIGAQTRIQKGELSDDALDAAFREAEAQGWHLGREAFMQYAERAIDQGVPMSDLAPLMSRIEMYQRSYRFGALDAYRGVRAEMSDAGIRVTDDEFRREAARHAQFMADPNAFGGQSPVAPELQPYAEKLVKQVRERILRPLIEAARKSGMFDRVAGGAEPDPNYWPVMFDRELVLADSTPVRRALIEMFKDEQRRALDIVEPYEKAVEAWRERGRLNRVSAKAAREGRKAGNDPTGLVKQWVQIRRSLGRHNADFMKVDQEVRRTFPLREGQSTTEWAEEVSRLAGERAQAWSDAFDAALPEAQAQFNAALADTAKIGMTRARQFIDAENLQRATDGRPALTAQEEGVIIGQMVEQERQSLRNDKSRSPAAVAAREAELETGISELEAAMAARWIDLRAELDKAIEAYETFRVRNNDEWRRITKPFVERKDQWAHGDGYEMPRFRDLKPVAPEGYDRARRKVRSGDPEAGPARLQNDISIAREADEIIHNLTLGEDPYRFSQLGVRGHFKGRGLEVDWNKLAPFMETDFTRIIDSYISMVVRDIETQRTFGSVLVNDVTAPLSAEAQRLQQIVSEPDRVDASLLYGDARTLHARAMKMTPEQRRAEAEAIGKEAQREADIIKAMFAQARGTFIAPAKSVNEAKVRSALQTGMNLMYVTRMGSGALAQIGDFTKATLHFGLTRTIGNYIRALGQTLGDIGRTDTTARKFMEQFGVMGEGRLLADQRLLYDVAPGGHRTALGRGLDRITPMFSRLTLMPFMNDMMRRGAINIVQDDLYRALTGDGRGAQMRMLRTQGGFTSDDIAQLRELARNHARRAPDGMMDFNVEEWATAYPELADKFRSAIHLATQRATIVPTAADTPTWTQTSLGRVISQFKRFVYASVPQLLIPALQSPGLRKLEIAAAAAAFGTISTVLRDLNAKGEVKDRNAGEWVLDALDMSGLTSAITDLDATLFKINPNLSARYLLVGETPARFMDRTAIASILGPLAGFVETGLHRAVDLPLAALDPNRDVSERNIAAFRQLWPYQNHIILRHPLDLIEAEAGGREQGPAVDWLRR